MAKADGAGGALAAPGTPAMDLEGIKEQDMRSMTMTDLASPCTSRREAPLRRAEDRQYLNMEIVYARHGGLAEGDDVARRLRRRSPQPGSLLARWIVERSIVSFYWRGRVLVPKFQFNDLDQMPRQEVMSIVSELTPFLDDWDAALWFVEPNAWIEFQLPIDLMASNPYAVLQAARGDRHVAKW